MNTSPATEAILFPSRETNVAVLHRFGLEEVLNLLLPLAQNHFFVLDLLLNDGVDVVAVEQVFLETGGFLEGVGLLEGFEAPMGDLVGPAEEVLLQEEKGEVNHLVAVAAEELLHEDLLVVEAVELPQVQNAGAQNQLDLVSHAIKRNLELLRLLTLDEQLFSLEVILLRTAPELAQSLVHLPLALDFEA